MAKAALVTSERGSQAALEQRRVLVVDDDLDFAEGLDLILSSEGYDVAIASTGRSAVDRLKESRPSVALIDIHLANSSGIDVIAQLRENDPTLRCVMITAFASAKTAIEAMKCGADDYLSKPVQSSELLMTLDRCFESIVLVKQKAEAEEALTTARNQFRDLLDNSPLAFNLKGLDGRYQFVNRQFCDWYGISRDEAVGQTSQGLFLARYANLYEALDRSLTQTLKPCEEECEVQFADGSVHRVVVSKYPIFDDSGELVGIGGFNQDVTRSRALEEKLRQTQKMEAVGQLVGGIAHDFNNMLMVIQSNAELLKRKLDDDARHLDLILSAAQYGSDLNKRLLAVASAQDLEPRTSDINRLILEMKELLSTTLGESIDFELSLAAEDWSVCIDPGQLESCILNLAINARDAMPDGGHLQISISNVSLGNDESEPGPTREAGDFVAIAVTDSGHGMSEEVKSRAFEPFFTTKDVGQGTGLGLSTVYGFAKHSDGFATIASEPASGTTVTLYLPRSENTIADLESKSSPQKKRAEGRSILLVEDNPSVRDSVLLMLEELGYQSIAASDAAEARHHVQSGKHLDLVLSDIVLPGGTNGWQLAEQIGASRPDLRILFMSGHSPRTDSAARQLAQQQRLLRKPFKVDELAEAIEKSLA